MLGTRLIGTALLIGGGALVVGVVVAAPTILRTGRPFIRQGLKRGLELYTRVRAAAAEFAEDVEDLVAEVQSELTHDRSGVSAAADSPREASRR